MIWQAKGLSATQAARLNRAMTQAQRIKAADLIALAAQQGEQLAGPEVGLRVQQERLRVLQQTL